MDRAVEFLKKNKFVLLVLAVGIVLILLPTGSTKPAVITVETTTEREEERMESILSAAEGVGRVRVMLGERDGALTGCVIVCDGAKSARVTLDLTEAASRLTGLGSDKIKVISMKGGEQ